PCTADPVLRIKPELVAPGRSVRSAWLGTEYRSGSGTSYSVAHVAGTVALMLEANPELTADSLKEILLLTAVDKGAKGDDNSYGKGNLDAYTAVMGALGGVGWISAHVTDPFGYPVEADVAFVGHPHWARSNADGDFSIAMPALMPLGLRITAATFEEFSQQVTLSPGDTTSLVIALLLQANLGILNGNVIDCFGQPADSAVISFPGSGVPDLYADAQGHFRATLTAGFYDVQASDGYCALGVMEDVQIVGRGMTDVEIVLPPNPNYLCSNPDPRGYRICDNNDPDGPESRWIEVAPALGGRGIVYNLSDDASIPVALPFPVVFYDQTYHRIFINANGNLTFRQALTEHTNTPIPRLCCPAIFPFWDDLNDSWGGDICTDYDPANGRFIVEWSNVPRYDGMGNETFQVLLHDTAVWPTTSGNTYLEIQYNDLSVTNSSTVGIDAGDGSGYLQYAYNGSYPSHASPLQDGRALGIAASQILGGTPQFAVANPSLNVVVPPGSVLDTSIILRNNGDAAVAYAFPPPGVTSLSSFQVARSNQTGGPPFEFFEIAGVGTNTGIVRDDTTSDPHLLPWFFPYCGRYFDRFTICSNGYISFTSCRSAQTYFHYPLSDIRDPFNALSPYWNDLDPSRGGAIFKYYDQNRDRFIIEWYQIRRYSSGGPNTFQCILYRDGKIEFVYGTMSPSLTYCTVGLKGGGPTEYRQLSYNQNYLQSDLLIRFSRTDTAATRLILTQAQQGIVRPMNQIFVPLRIQNNSMALGQTVMSLALACSDPLWPIVPIEVQVAAVPDPADLQLIAIPQPDGIRLVWNRLASPYYCVYSGLPGGVNRFEGATADTTLLLPYGDDEYRCFEIRLCGNPPFRQPPPGNDDARAKPEGMERTKR
ncbi:S8 family serine peptidase, partial [bacterium]|nr:S8 family serine peptidase [bacterium]